MYSIWALLSCVYIIIFMDLSARKCLEWGGGGGGGGGGSVNREIRGNKPRVI